MNRKIVVAVLGGLALQTAGCANVAIRQAEQRPLLETPTDAKPEPIRLQKMVFDLKRGTPIGGFRYNPIIGCRFTPGEITWGSGRWQSDSLELADIFFQEMSSAGYDVLGDPSQMFPDHDQNRASYIIGGRISSLQVDLCDSVVFGIRYGIKGDAYIKVAWQVYDKIDRRVIFSTSTEGTFVNNQATVDGETVAFNGAFANAVANLAADKGFHDLVLNTVPAGTSNAVDARRVRTISPLGLPAIRLPHQPPYSTPIASHMEKVRSAAVTIVVDSGHGSGFFVSSTGLILTNYHVVGESKLVKVRLFNGREVIGEVLRRHKQRDVALVLVEEAGYPALPVRAEPLTVGEDIYAIGSPLHEKLANTVSKGIVSAIRRDPETGLEDIQGDVDIHGGNSGGPLVDAQGNLVGITYAGYGGQPTSVGLNLFIPIMDATAKLNLKIADDR